MYRAEVLTGWVQVRNHSTFNVFSVWLDYRRLFSSDGSIQRDGLITCEDITGQDGATIPPDPNLMAVLVVGPQVTIEDIMADQDYYVMWLEETDAT